MVIASGYASTATVFVCLMSFVSVTSLASQPLLMMATAGDKQAPSPAVVSAVPVRTHQDLTSSILRFSTYAPMAAALALAQQKASAKDAANDVKNNALSLGEGAYTDLGGLKMCKILTGMWQVSGAHGYEPQKQSAVSEMFHCAGASSVEEGLWLTYEEIALRSRILTQYSS